MLNSGGPAFPVPRAYTEPNLEVAQWEELGITVRDYFAAKALQGAIAAGSTEFVCEKITRNALQANISVAELFARDAYRVADAMLVARDKQAE